MVKFQFKRRSLFQKHIIYLMSLMYVAKTTKKQFILWQPSALRVSTTMEVTDSNLALVSYGDYCFFLKLWFRMVIQRDIWLRASVWLFFYLTFNWDNLHLEIEKISISICRWLIIYMDSASPFGQWIRDSILQKSF